MSFFLKGFQFFSGDKNYDDDDDDDDDDGVEDEELNSRTTDGL